jgi:hypothetical protein
MSARGLECLEEKESVTFIVGWCIYQAEFGLSEPCAARSIGGQVRRLSIVGKWKGGRQAGAAFPVSCSRANVQVCKLKPITGKQS